MNLNDAVLLAAWYQDHKRDLPWRDTGSPYHVWVSEIMLQQTRIEAVKPKYERFMQELPDIASLAECPEDKLMKLWEGLGYYARARNLKKCAIVLMKEYQGRLPADYDALLHLPGIGPYTAGAIASISFGIAVPAVDGNVLRVLSRYGENTADVRLPSVHQEAEQIVKNIFSQKHDPSFVKAFNQGLMELGETLCIPNGTPACSQCPLSAECLACCHGSWDRIPVRSALGQRKIVERTLYIIRDGKSFLLHKRPGRGLLAGLYEFPGINGFQDEKAVLRQVEKLGLVPLHIRTLPEAKHIFTHLEWHMHAYEVMCAETDLTLRDDWTLATKKELADLAVPSAFKTYLDWYSLHD
ncbi:MAG: A/G-specific adenine glycosylase [Lactimicrobium sp.]|uniref:A/G-specific adenine glycosylase n=1 Tax=Lactimicrobium sp. TaxID=2563780 RepID=UPI002F3549B1